MPELNLPSPPPSTYKGVWERAILVTTIARSSPTHRNRHAIHDDSRSVGLPHCGGA
ncbi:hypothetical protein H6G52_09255 [Limnothrix sp. FACHB-881]|nr:hypothetical protein [Limnothrix sp. FACHB-881]